MKLAAVFSNHAVFQRGIAIPVWGWAEPETTVRATLGQAVAQTVSGADGRFLVRLPPFSAGGPYQLEVNAGDERIMVTDILIGEVWLASGQSNMEWRLFRADHHSDEARRGIDRNSIRMLTTPHRALIGRQSDLETEWQVATPETVGRFSAVAYHFALKLQDTLNVPVGILNASRGGTIIEAWMSREALIQNPDTRALTERYEATSNDPVLQEEAVAVRDRLFPVDPGNEGEGRGWASSGFADADWPRMTLPQLWQNAGHEYSGVFWFRISIDLPDDWVGKELSLHLGAADKHDITYFNGERVGATGTNVELHHFDTPRVYSIPARLTKADRNVIAVRVYSFFKGGGLTGPVEKMYLSRADGQCAPISLAAPWYYQEEQNFGHVSSPPPLTGPGCANSPYMLFDNLIHPLIPYAIRGAIWYQGESNTESQTPYRGMLISLIRDWRRAWGQGDFPFIAAQLPNFGKASCHQDESRWALLREAQLQILAEPNAGMSINIDLGEAANLHPINKKDVGERLAQAALVKVYGQPGVASGPLYAGMTIEGRAIRLHFENCGAGLTDQGRPLSHFVVSGLDKHFFPATARIEGTSIVVESKEVSMPMAARYAWADNPEGCNLYNQDGYPASPFRTDYG